MSSVLLDFEAAPAATGPAREPTLDDLVVDAWRKVVSGRAGACPICQGTMEPREGRGAARGRCGDCGASLS